MKDKLKKLLSKTGLSEPEQALVVRIVVISTLICALLIAGFWAFHVFADSVPAKLTGKRASGKDKDAAAVFTGISDLDVEAHEFAALRHIQAGRPEAALPHLKRITVVRRGGPAAAGALDRMVDAYLELGEFEKALETADGLLSTAGDSLLASLRVRKGIALYNLKLYGESAEFLQKVLEDNPRNAEALCFMGQMEAAAQTRSPTAERFFRRAIEADPNYMEAKYQFARYFENNGDLRTAREFLQQVLAKEPLNVRAHARLGMVHYYEFNADMALKSYQTALALNPYDYNTRYNLGELYRTLLEDNENALKEFVAALEHNPNHGEANYKAGLICVGNEMMKEGIRYFEASLKSDRKNIRRLLQLAAAYERIGDVETALSIYKEITNLDPLHSIAIQKIRLLEMGIGTDR